ncbi:Diacylglycerol acyltransferase/mycolyltransferase Ag85A precursor [Corynebacterium occultum]|uniref:Diacylglycerol acyltransferase/mycolyltransferase Ag85A n=1 Tax=Corynebacterium occultum TaxID=2675219 RepID=A0A6B8W7T7_9CORY|nr:alpha/beta hydrolase family protein [Corynebacterium occultum]QGU07997.1 Diacylglycerol acyltransferase/mycolyltransferase Ag85A precursor [Corynebacterium occultum]
MSRSVLRTTLATTLSAALLCSTPVLAQSATEESTGESAGASSLSSGSSLFSFGSSANSDESGDASPAEEEGSVLGSANSLLQALITGSSQSTTSSGLGVNGLLGLLNLVGLYETQFSGPLLSSESGYPLTTDESINTAEILSRETDTRAPRLERWHIASPSMKRVVEVQIMRPADDSAAAPMIYLLDGIGGNKNSSGWINGGEAPKVFAEENATVVMPLGAAASMYSDWEQEDPALGTIKWETFIVEELAPLLEAESELNFNGKRAIGGLSMGATGAVNLANSNPDFFDGVIGISGCYSTLDPVGRQTVNLIVGSRGGDVENMWGPYGSETWVEHDVTANPEGLRDMAVYLSVANGSVTAGDKPVYTDQPFFNMIAGVVLERGALECTYNLDKSMHDKGMDHQVVEYKSGGLHNWDNYNEQLQPGWDAIKHVLY